MKRLLLLLMISVGLQSNAQCNIVGNETIKIGQKTNYSINNDNAQCTDCHLWVSIGGNSILEGDFRKNTITINPTFAGRTVLSLSILTQNGLIQCSKNIDVTPAGNTYSSNNSGNNNNAGNYNNNSSNNNNASNNTSANSNMANNSDDNNVNCNINVNNFSEVKVGNGVVSFLPSSTDNDYSYIWTVNYLNGSSQKSNKKVPQFQYSVDNPIIKVNIKITSSTCIREFSKVYDASFWMFF